MNRGTAMLWVSLTLLSMARPAGASAETEWLAPAQVSAALAYGQETAGQRDEAFAQEWLVDAPDGTGVVLVKTPFFALAFLARQAAQQHRQPPSQKELDTLLFLLKALRETVNVQVVLFQRPEEVGARYEFRLVNGSTPQTPISLERVLSEPQAAPGDRPFETRFNLYFWRPDSSTAAPVRLEVLKDGQPAFSLPLDLSKFR